jgi:hypothetical protein
VLTSGAQLVDQQEGADLGVLLAVAARPMARPGTWLTLRPRYPADTPARYLADRSTCGDARL